MARQAEDREVMVRADPLVEYLVATTPASSRSEVGGATAAPRPGRTAALAALRSCALCGRAGDRAGRFCSSCLGVPPRGVHPGARRPARPWLRATSGLRWVELLFLLVDVLIGGATGALVLRLLAEVHRNTAAGAPAGAMLSHADVTLATIVGAGMVASSVGSGLLFWAWMVAAYRNVGVLGLRRRWHVGWAVGSWLVPLANLWWPKRIVEELWLGSHRSTPVGATLDRRASTPLVSAWWTALVVSATMPLLACAVVVAARHHWGFTDLGQAAELGLCAVVLAVVCRVGNGLLAMVLIDRITTAQCERAIALGGQDPG